MFQKVRKKPPFEEIHSKNLPKKSSHQFEQQKSTFYPDKRDETPNKTKKHLKENIENLRRFDLNEVEEDCPEKSNQNLPRLLQDIHYLFRKKIQRKKEEPKKTKKYTWKPLSEIKVNN